MLDVHGLCLCVCCKGYRCAPWLKGLDLGLGSAGSDSHPEDRTVGFVFVGHLGIFGKLFILRDGIPGLAVMDLQHALIEQDTTNLSKMVYLLGLIAHSVVLLISLTWKPTAGIADCFRQQDRDLHRSCGDHWGHLNAFWQAEEATHRLRRIESNTAAVLFGVGCRVRETLLFALQRSTRFHKLAYFLLAENERITCASISLERIDASNASSRGLVGGIAVEQSVFDGEIRFREEDQRRSCGAGRSSLCQDKSSLRFKEPKSTGLLHFHC